MAQAALGFACPIADCGKDAFNRVCRADVLPMLGLEVVERQQHVAILGQLLDRPLVFDAVGFNEQIEGRIGLLLRLGHPDILQRCLGLFMQGLWHRAGDVGHLVDPAALFFRRRVHVPQCGQKTHGPVPTGQIGRNRQPSFFQAAKKVSPAVRVLAEPVHDAKNILVSVFVRANNHLHTLTIIVQARVEVDTVGPNIDVALS